MQDVSEIPPLHERIRALRESIKNERGRPLSQPDFAKRLTTTGFEMLRAIETPDGSVKNRYPSPEVLADIARAAGLEPEDAFPEYRLALARQMLDEREVGIDQALAALTRFEEALQRPESLSRREATRTASGRQRAQADSPGARSRKAT